MSKVLIISSSMRKGNSDTLAQEFFNGCKDANHKVEKVDLRKLKINYCLGCSACQETGNCVLEDDVKDIIEKVRVSDVLVFATPIYFGNLAGQLKVLLDRFYPLYQNVSSKKVYIIASCYQDSKKHIDESLVSLERILEDIGNLKIEKIIYAQNCDGVNDTSKEQRKSAYDAGKNLD